jgi:hypothetical protein
MDAFCLFVAGALRAMLPVPEFTLTWMHSVEKVSWEERYRVDDGALRLVEARVRGHGAGMEPSPQARRDGDAWVWWPESRLPELVLARSTATSDYRLCAAGHCQALGAWTATPPDAGAVTLRTCGTAEQPSR